MNRITKVMTTGALACFLGGKKMKKNVMKVLSVLLIILGITACKNNKKEILENKIEAEKIILQNNIEKVLNELDFQNKYSMSIIYQQTQNYSNRTLSEQIITKRIFGKADFSEQSNNPESVDGMWEEKSYTANYDEKKENDDIEYGYFSVIITFDNLDKDRQDKIIALMNYSVANSTRGDVINVISKSDFSNNK